MEFTLELKSKHVQKETRGLNCLHVEGDAVVAYCRQLVSDWGDVHVSLCADRGDVYPKDPVEWPVI